jgi:hypothetical protein
LALQAPDADSARRAATEILSEGRFHPEDPPRPLKGALEAIGDWLRRVFEPLVDGAQDLVGGPEQLWTLLGLVVILASISFAASLGRRRAAKVRRAAGAPSRSHVDPGELEAAAAAAESEGDFAGAVRLRFRAGVARLARAGVVDERPSLTSAEIRRRLRVPEFDEIAASFDRIVYGRRPATADDAAAARERWQRVLAASRAL